MDTSISYPGGAALEALADDYRRMGHDGLLLDDAEDFDALLRHCQAIERRVNAA